MNEDTNQQTSKDVSRETLTCDYHPEAHAAGTCTSCQKPVCAECKVILGGETYCNPCADRLFVRADRISKVKTTTWFEEHLNLTLLLAILEANIIFFAIIPILATLSIELSDQSWQMLAYVVGLMVLMPVAGWILKKKNRSHLYLFLLIVPLGLVWLLMLENRGGEQAPSSNQSGR